jgi:hypothetical protein
MRDFDVFDPNVFMQQQLQHFKTLVTQLQEGKEAAVEVYF